MGSPAEPKDTAKTGEIKRGTSCSQGLLNFKNAEGREDAERRAQEEKEKPAKDQACRTS
jgi:hypothetical protein